VFNTKSDIPADKREQLCKLLNNRLASLIDLQLQTKQAHWNVKGPSFIALHELFDKVAEESEDYIDTVAERVTALGGVAEGTLAVVGKRTSLKPYPLEIVTGRDHVDALSGALAAVAKQVRSAIDEANTLGDTDTADLFTQISRDVDKQLWFVEAHLQSER